MPKHKEPNTPEGGEQGVGGKEGDEHANANLKTSARSPSHRFLHTQGHLYTRRSGEIRRPCTGLDTGHARLPLLERALTICFEVMVLHPLYSAVGFAMGYRDATSL